MNVVNVVKNYYKIKELDMSKWIVLISTFFLGLFITSSFAQEKKEGEVTLTVYYSNDIIGYLTPCG